MKFNLFEKNQSKEQPKKITKPPESTPQSTTVTAVELVTPPVPDNSIYTEHAHYLFLMSLLFYALDNATHKQLQKYYGDKFDKIGAENMKNRIHRYRTHISEVSKSLLVYYQDSEAARIKAIDDERKKRQGDKYTAKEIPTLHHIFFDASSSFENRLHTGCRCELYNELRKVGVGDLNFDALNTNFPEVPTLSSRRDIIDFAESLAKNATNTVSSSSSSASSSSSSSFVNNTTPQDNRLSTVSSNVGLSSFPRSERTMNPENMESSIPRELSFTPMLQSNTTMPVEYTNYNHQVVTLTLSMDNLRSIIRNELRDMFRDEFANDVHVHPQPIQMVPDESVIHISTTPKTSSTTTTMNPRSKNSGNRNVSDPNLQLLMNAVFSDDEDEDNGGETNISTALEPNRDKRQRTELEEDQRGI